MKNSLTINSDQNVEHENFDSTIPFLGIQPEDKCTYNNLHYSTIYCSKESGTTLMPINGRLVKYPCN